VLYRSEQPTNAEEGVMQSLKDTARDRVDRIHAAALHRALRFPLGLETFFAWCARTITCPNEYCILDPSWTMILLFKRPADDRFFADQWHVSGTVYLPGEAPHAVWPRLLASGKYGLAGLDLSQPVHVGSIDTEHGPQSEGKCPRGAERNMIFAVICPDPSKARIGTWHRLDMIDKIDLIGHHRRYLREILIPWRGW
jgi:hypothetical protein